MDFEEFLKKMGMSTVEFNDLPQAEKDYINISYYTALQKANETEKEKRQREQDDKKALADKKAAAEKAQLKSFYDKWHTHFLSYSGNLPQENFKDISSRDRAQQQRQTDERKKQALLMARKSCGNDLTQLLFAEADAMDASLKLESWERMIPVGRSFSEAFDAIKSDCTKEKKLSTAMRELKSMSVDHDMYARLLKRYDDDPKALEMSSEELARDLFKNAPDSYQFYQEHRMDNERYANPENLDFTMKEMFRLGDRMSRNPRMSKPMKELCAKINSLKKDYTANPGKYADMPRGRLNHLMQSIDFAADAYMADKKNSKSFSSTQLERLKCINQLKTLQKSFTVNANDKNFSYGMSGNHMDTGFNYPANALAEKLVLASFVETKQGAGMCNREDIQDRAYGLLENPDYKRFVSKLVEGAKATMDPSPSLEKVYDSLLKTNGQKLVKAYRKFQKDAFQQRMDEMYNKEGAVAETSEPVMKNTLANNNAPAKKPGGMGMKA